ncbi:HAMP domain-containing protein [Micromonospora sp. KLBMP9576]|uniref:HAMP domain-containing protein n=1 Tax=Micromonospora sp. KLBMP9576 TaxID=3424769 RepID=UPI003D8E0898
MIPRLTARGRLTLLYTALVLAAGALLLALTYLLLLRGSLRLPSPTPDDDVGGRLRGEAIFDLLTRAALALLVVTALAALTGWLVAGRILRPLREISATTNRLSAENLSERVPVRQPADELTALAGTINGMLDRIQHGIADRDRVLSSQRLFVANAAHELRTPLTTMRTAVDVTLDGEPDRAELVAMAGDIATAVETSQRTLDGLLILARSQAVRYNHAGGNVTMVSGTANGRAFLRVVNTGPLVTPEEERWLFEPFVRGAGNGTRGAGLGLSIVRAVVTAHDGGISSIARPTGGMDIAVHLPPAPKAAISGGAVAPHAGEGRLPSVT